MANQITYFNSQDFKLDYNQDTLGLLLDGIKFVALDSLDFADAIATIKNFALHIDNGSCTFIKEFRKSGDSIKPYWYACKRTNGKLKKLYFGADFTKDKLMQIVDRLQVAQVAQVAQVTQLAGHGKSDRHLQTDLIDCHEQLAIAQNEIVVLNKMLKDAHEDVASANRKEHEQWCKIKPLEVQVEKRNKIIDSLEQTVKDLTQITTANQDLIEKYRAMTVGKNKKAHPRYAYLIDFLTEIDNLS